MLGIRTVCHQTGGTNSPLAAALASGPFHWRCWQQQEQQKRMPQQLRVNGRIALCIDRGAQMPIHDVLMPTPTAAPQALLLLLLLRRPPRPPPVLMFVLPGARWQTVWDTPQYATKPQGDKIQWRHFAGVGGAVHEPAAAVTASAKQFVLAQTDTRAPVACVRFGCGCPCSC